MTIIRKLGLITAVLAVEHLRRRALAAPFNANERRFAQNHVLHP